MKNWFKKNRKDLLFLAGLIGVTAAGFVWMTNSTKTEEVVYPNSPPLTDEQLAEIVSWASGVEYDQVLADIQSSS